MKRVLGLVLAAILLTPTGSAHAASGPSGPVRQAARHLHCDPSASAWQPASPAPAEVEAAWTAFEALTCEARGGYRFTVMRAPSNRSASDFVYNLRHHWCGDHSACGYLRRGPMLVLAFDPGDRKANRVAAKRLHRIGYDLNMRRGKRR